MSATCPRGHDSTTTDYCDQCGALMNVPPVIEEEPSHATRTAAAARSVLVAAQPAGEPCLTCGVPRSGQDRFCESCGHDFTTGTPAQLAVSPAPALTWEVVVSADRAYFEQTAPEGVEFPEDYPPRKFVLDRERLRVGRDDSSIGDAPEIDLSVPPVDPAVSHLQAVLVRQVDGSYSVIDPGSTNGVTLNDNPQPLAANVAVPLSDGDRLRLGAWTRLTVRGPETPPAAAAAAAGVE